MGNKQLLPIYILISLTFIECNNPTDNIKNGESTQTIHSENINTENNPKVSKTFKLLQGKWQHTEDKSNYLVFDKNHRKEIADGMTDWDDEVFILSNHCVNQTDSSSQDKRDADSYISCMKSDMCWSIVSLDSNNLTLMYMGRGNLLTYKRVKE